MLRLGIIGTGNIAHQFITACQLTEHYKLAAVYSRTTEKAQSFAAPYGEIELYTDLKAFSQSNLDVVYIASPNSLHFQQAKMLILAGKHLIVEKPAFSNPSEFQAIIKLAEEKQVLVLEAARNYHEKNWQPIQDFLADKVIYGASFHFSQYSSRMKNLLQGIYDNAFQAKMSGGALVDLGIYQIYAAHKLFGQPKAARYCADLLETGVDIAGSGQLLYEDFHVNMVVRKNAQSNLPSEIYTNQGTLILNHIQGIEKASFHDLDGRLTNLELAPLGHLMAEETQVFADILMHPNKHQELYKQLLSTAQSVNQTLYAMRQDSGIHFEADQHEN
ncbi:Gfo/Idh/MocA family protein [Streptococcus ovuberis]|uniref:Gfo/Idh/MocA family oxidoreductase n=1 Tax=Streptococcus ovuberis TaxID=1936207 RepID=A0A7X6S007_9STRE|nr:Gfo/Idh/MocA family oxidoreductase [Streptococcus ovuberis]NKZ19277.1 Gfo/Idh/MocA family oxidoreductase [Streptococcus ovuberis]